MNKEEIKKLIKELNFTYQKIEKDIKKKFFYNIKRRK